MNKKKINKENKRLVLNEQMNLLITIIHREKMDFYIDALQQFDINAQFVLIGNGTTKTTVYVDEQGSKAIIISIITDEKVKPALEFLEEKFKTIKRGKGIAFTIPFSSIIGVQLFNFLSNNKEAVI